jgi:hypothetical protein
VGSVMHAAMPSLFIVATEGVRHMIRHLAGLASGTRIEGIPFARWLLAPRSSFLLWRRMVLWHVTSYHQALGLEQARILAVSRLQETHGRLLWRWKAPLSERLALRMVPVTTHGTDALAAVAPVEMARSSAIAPPEAEPASAAIPAGTGMAADDPSLIPLTVVGLLPKRHDVEIDPPGRVPLQLSERDRQLVEVASGILRVAEENGTPLSQAALARDLRSQGLAIANDRLRWLMRAAGERPSTGRPPRDPGRQGTSDSPAEPARKAHD